MCDEKNSVLKKELWKGNEAIAEAALRAGCECFFGYPITPQNEIPEYMALHMEEHGGVFVQSESEVAAINMVYGAAATGKRAMTSSSSPGISLKQEGITYLAGAELPCLIVNCMRGGPGLGTIQPAQGDYHQATRGGGNGDYHVIVLAPSDIQEAVEMVQEGFDLADLYRIPVMLLCDGLIGQMMEPIVWKKHEKRQLPEKEWVANGDPNRKKNRIVTSLYLDPGECEQHNQRLTEKYREIARRETRRVCERCEGAEIILTAYGTPARIALSVLDELEKRGVKAGLFRPQTLWPFPAEELRQVAGQESVRAVLDIEMSSVGQMLDDVKLALEGLRPVRYFGRSGGMIPTVEEITEAALTTWKEAGANGNCL